MQQNKLHKVKSKIMKSKNYYVAIYKGNEVARDSDLLKLRHKLRSYLITYNGNYSDAYIINKNNKKLRP